LPTSPSQRAIHRRLEDYQVDAVFLRARSAGDFTSDTVATLHLTLPLFLCSASRQTALKRVQQQISVMRGMLDWLDLGMLVLDQDARVVTSNAAGDALIAGERLLRIAPDGSLVCRRPADTKVLRLAIEQVCGNVGGKSEFVVKLGESENRCRLGFVLGASPQGQERWQSHALLLVLPARPAMVSREMLDTLGLLPSEQRFLLSFLEAGSLAEGACKAGVSEKTAKTYLKRIRSKLGVRRQIELAQLIYGQSPPLRCGFGAGQLNGGSHALA
jgi:DNA-binding CsgD family transcriptional regulator